MGAPLQPLFLLTAVCLAPFVSFYAQNLHENLHWRDLAPYALSTWIAAWALYALGRATLRANPLRLSALIATAFFALFHYYDAAIALKQLGASPPLQLAGWGVSSLALLVGAAAFGQRPLFHPLLSGFVVLGMALPLYRIATIDLPGQGPALPIEQAYPLGENDVWSGTAVRKPDIYWIVPDSYPSFAQLRDYYQFDNGAFAAFLETRGFLVGRNVFANFSTTRLSIPTSLNMDYVFEDGESYSKPMGREHVALPGHTNRGIVAAITGDNRSVGFLKQLGYRYVHFEGRSFQLTRCRGREDVCIQGELAGPSELQHNLLSRLPYHALFQLSPSFRRHFEPKRRSASGTGIPELSRSLGELEVQRPFFVYAHLSSPHRPFMNAADCSLLPLNFDRRGNRHFLNQLQCVNRQLRDLIDQILRDDPESIILLSSDHGPRYSVRAGTPLYSMGPIEIRESLGILAAIRLPDACHSESPFDLSPINHMRSIFACIGGHAPRFVEDKHFISRPDSPDRGKLRRVEPR